MKIYIFPILVCCLIGCKDNGVSVSEPPDIPISELLAADDTITVEGRQLFLSTYMWRDFQPISPPDGKPLIAIVYVTATDTARLPISISTDAIWVVFNNQVWKSWFTNQQIMTNGLNQIAKLARDGPKWGPEVYVDVIVRVKHGQGNQFLRASNQWIGRTE